MSLKQDLLSKGYLLENLPPAFNTEEIARYFSNKPNEYLSGEKAPVRPAMFNASKGEECRGGRFQRYIRLRRTI